MGTMIDWLLGWGRNPPGGGEWPSGVGSGPRRLGKAGTHDLPSHQTAAGLGVWAEDKRNRYTE